MLRNDLNLDKKERVSKRRLRKKKDKLEEGD